MLPGPCPFEQGIGLMFLIGAAVRAQNLAKTPGMIEGEGRSVALEDPEFQSLLGVHRLGQERRAQPLSVAGLPDIEMIDPAFPEGAEAVEDGGFGEPDLAFGEDMIAEEGEIL